MKIDGHIKKIAKLPVHKAGPAGHVPLKYNPNTSPNQELKQGNWFVICHSIFKNEKQSRYRLLSEVVG